MGMPRPGKIESRSKRQSKRTENGSRESNMRTKPRPTSENKKRYTEILAKTSQMIKERCPRGQDPRPERRTGRTLRTGREMRAGAVRDRTVRTAGAHHAALAGASTATADLHTEGGTHRRRRKVVWSSTSYIPGRTKWEKRRSKKKLK